MNHHSSTTQLCATAIVLLTFVTREGDLLGAAETSESTAAITGAVTYRADPARPWRYARYYVKRPSSGELAEAVVAIRRVKHKADVPPHEPQTVTIDQKTFQFTPELVAIRAGDSVTFTNSDDSIHNVRASTRTIDFNVNILAGGSHTEKFARAGGARDPVAIGCVFHSSMRAWIFVFDLPWFAVTDEKGQFRLDGLPPGEYDLDMTHPAGDLRWTGRIAVKSGQTLSVDITVSPDDKK